MDKDEMIAAARAVAARLGTRRISEEKFLKSQRMSRKRLYRHFRSWREFCDEAGLEPIIARPALSDDRIFQALHDAFLAYGGVGTLPEMKKKLKISIDTVYRRSGTWRQALVDFAAWANDNAPNFPHAAEIEARIASLRRMNYNPVRQNMRLDGRLGPPWRTVGGRLCGDPLHDGPMLHEPTNENGVILIFGMLARELGFVVESVAPGFPDCTAKRRVGPKQWESVRIEFEFRSRNFVGHGHDPKGCDVIVCWEHDWPDCPLEVLELKPAMVGR